MLPGRCLQGKTVMVIDDEISVTRLIYDTLNWHGASIHVAHSGSQAYERLRSGRYDLIICGRLFPGLTGHSLYRLLESWMPAMNHRYLFISSESTTARTWQFFSQAGAEFLRKPFGIRDLLEAVDRLFNRTLQQDS
jgi:two-component system, OmpR family, alkaline phosphatase synthesis response regulator PhoP